MKVKISPGGYKPMQTNPKRVKEGVAKMREALKQDYLDSLHRPPGLPKDWRSRLIKAN